MPLLNAIWHQLGSRWRLLRACEGHLRAGAGLSQPLEQPGARRPLRVLGSLRGQGRSSGSLGAPALSFLCVTRIISCALSDGGSHADAGLPAGPDTVVKAFAHADSPIFFSCIFFLVYIFPQPMVMHVHSLSQPRLKEVCCALSYSSVCTYSYYSYTYSV